MSGRVYIAEEDLQKVIRGEAIPQTIATKYSVTRQTIYDRIKSLGYSVKQLQKERKREEQVVSVRVDASNPPVSLPSWVPWIWMNGKWVPHEEEESEREAWNRLLIELDHRPRCVLPKGFLPSGVDNAKVCSSNSGSPS